MNNKTTTVKTNDKAGSVQEIPLKVIKFDDLWDAYPSSKIGHIDPQTREDIFEDHCAINVSAALYKCGVLLKTFRGTRCWRCPTPDSKTKKGIHAIRAQELSDYLETRPFAGCPKPLVLTGENYMEDIKGKTGIIFFKDFWLRAGEKTPTGDHIDLWKAKKLAGSGGAGSFFRVNFPSATEAVTGVFGSSLRVSDLTKSRRILFWEIE